MRAAVNKQRATAMHSRDAANCPIPASTPAPPSACEAKLSASKPVIASPTTWRHRRERSVAHRGRGGKISAQYPSLSKPCRAPLGRATVLAFSCRPAWQGGGDSAYCSCCWSVAAWGSMIMGDTARRRWGADCQPARTLVIHTQATTTWTVCHTCRWVVATSAAPHRKCTCTRTC